MIKLTLGFDVERQRLTRRQIVCEASNTVRYTDAVFGLGEGWDGFDVIRAIWTNGPETIATVLDSRGQCVIPHEVLARKGEVKVNLVGSISDSGTLTDRLTSYPIIALLVDATAKVEGDNSADLTPSQVEQFAAAVHEDAVLASESAVNAAESELNASQSASSASQSETNAAASERNAAASERNAAASEDNAAASAASADADADRAEQAASQAGFVQFRINEEGHLIMTRVNSPYTFYLENGHIFVTEVD